MRTQLFFLFFLFIGLHAGLLSAEDSVLKEAKKAFSRKAYAESVKKFTQYAESHPSDGVPYMFMGYIYEYKKDYARSIQNFRKSVELNLEKEQKKTVLLKLSLFFNFHQDWNLAAVYSSRFLKYDSKNEEVQKIFNRAVGNKGNPSASFTLGSIDKVADQKPNRTSETAEKEKSEKPEKSEKLEKSKSEKTEPTDKQEKKEEVTEASRESSKAYEKDLEKNPNDEDLRWEYTLALFEEKKWDKAEENLKILIEKNASRSRYHYKLGMVKLRKEDPQGALESFEKAKKNPFSKDTNVFLYFVFLNEGLAYQKLKRYPEAEESFKKAFQQSPKDPPVLALARLNHLQSNWSDCSKNAETAVNIGGQPEAHMFKFICNAEEGKPLDQWETNFEKYFKFLDKGFPDPSQAPEKLQIGFLRLARQLTTAGKLEKSESYFQIVAKDKNQNQSREYLFYRGRNLFYMGKWEDSLVYLQQVPNSSAAYYLIARVHAKKNDMAKTKNHINLAASLKPEYWDFALKETDFQEFRKDSGFLEFLQKKGQ